MSIKDDIKSLIVKSGWSLKDLAMALNKKYGRSASPTNISNKLARESLTLKEAMEIADIIGYSIEWLPKEKL